MSGDTAALLLADTWLAARAYRWANRFDLHGKRILITGGSRGLGLILGRQAVREGAQVPICARDRAELARARAGLANAGQSVLPVRCDVTDKNQVGRMIEVVTEHFGGIDVLINNSGTISFPGLTTDILSLVNSLLPEPKGGSRVHIQGKDSESSSFLTSLLDRAARGITRCLPGESEAHPGKAPDRLEPIAKRS